MEMYAPHKVSQILFARNGLDILLKINDRNIVNFM